MEFNYDLTVKNDVAIFALEGNLLSAYLGDDLLKEVKTTIEEDQLVKLVLDLKKLEYLNSSGLGILIRLLTKARQANGECAIIHINDRLKKLLVITKLDTLFIIENNLNDAIKKLELALGKKEKEQN